MADAAKMNDDNRSGIRDWFPYTRRIQLWGVAFILPAIAFLAVFKYGPMGWAFWLSFTNYDMLSSPEFIGIENYRRLMDNPIFWEVLRNTLFYIIASTVSITLVSLGLAMAINANVPGARLSMTAMFFTNLMPIVAVSLVWRLLLHPYGLVNQLLSPFGAGRIDWLTSPDLALPAIVMVTVWRFAPYFMVIFLAALLALPRDYYEAAQIDGAGPFRRFWYLTLPLMMPTIFFVVVVSGLLSAQIFLLPYIITGGGPGNSTRVLSMLIFETGFSFFKMGQAAAISVILFGIMLCITALQLKLFSRGEEVYSR